VQYQVRYLSGTRVVARVLTASDEAAAAGTIAAWGVLPQQVLSVTARAEPGRVVIWGQRSSLSLRMFSRELAVLLAASVPLLEAVTTLSEKEDSAEAARALNGVALALAQGVAFSAALAAQPAVFDSLFVAIVSAAEGSGQLQQALREHADYLAWAEAMRNTLWAACIYPALLVVSSGAVLVFLLVHVVPRFAALLDGMQAQMPWASRLLLQLGAWAGREPLLTVGGALALLVVPLLLARLPAPRAWAAALLWRAPQLGPRLRLLALARLYRTLGMLLTAGVPLVPALRAARSVLSPLLQPAVDAVATAVAQGQRLSAALDEQALATPVSARMVRVGERSGELGPMLRQAAAFYDEELARLSDWVTRLVNPVLMLLMGGLIGTVIVMLYLPIFQLAEQVQ